MVSWHRLPFRPTRPLRVQQRPLLLLPQPVTAKPQPPEVRLKQKNLSRPPPLLLLLQAQVPVTLPGLRPPLPVLHLRQRRKQTKHPQAHLLRLTPPGRQRQARPIPRRLKTPQSPVRPQLSPAKQRLRKVPLLPPLLPPPSRRSRTIPPLLPPLLWHPRRRQRPAKPTPKPARPTRHLPKPQQPQAPVRPKPVRPTQNPAKPMQKPARPTQNPVKQPQGATLKMQRPHRAPLRT